MSCMSIATSWSGMACLRELRACAGVVVTARSERSHRHLPPVLACMYSLEYSSLTHPQPRGWVSERRSTVLPHTPRRGGLPHSLLRRGTEWKAKEERREAWQRNNRAPSSAAGVSRSCWCAEARAEDGVEDDDHCSLLTTCTERGVSEERLCRRASPASLARARRGATAGAEWYARTGNSGLYELNKCSSDG